MVIKGCAMAVPLSPHPLLGSSNPRSLSLILCALLVANCATVLVTIMADSRFTPLAIRGVNGSKLIRRIFLVVQDRSLRDY